MKQIGNIPFRFKTKRIKLFFFTLLMALRFGPVSSQVLISNGTGVPDSAAMLEMKSTEKGFLPPRMTKDQREMIVNPTAGLIIYCSDCLEMQMYNHTAWTNMIGLPPTDPPIPTITIGTQTWMANNLDVGTMITGATNMTNNSILEKYCYDDDPANCATYGALYQWDEMMQYTTIEGVQGVCPTGWHLPTDNEYKTLEMQLGMTQEQADAIGWRGTDQGSQLAGNEPIWSNGNLDQDANFGTSGFESLPSGFRNSSGLFNNQSNFSGHWSSTKSAEPWRRFLDFNYTKVRRSTNDKLYGFSVRCVRD